MRRRKFVKGASSILISAGIAGCTFSGDELLDSAVDQEYD